MISDYIAQILRQEISKPVYDGMDAQAAYNALFVGKEDTKEIDVTVRLSVLGMCALIGPEKTDKAVGTLKAQFPNIWEQVLTADLANPYTQAFIDQIAEAGIISADDKAKVNALLKQEVKTVATPRFVEVFSPANWPHVDESGKVTDDTESPPLTGFPNAIDLSDWMKIWLDVRL